MTLAASAQAIEGVYVLWEIGGESQWGEQALALLMSEYDRTPRAVYRNRIKALHAAGLRGEDGGAPGDI